MKEGGKRVAGSIQERKNTEEGDSERRAARSCEKKKKKKGSEKHRPKGESRGGLIPKNHFLLVNRGDGEVTQEGVHCSEHNKKNRSLETGKITKSASTHTGLHLRGKRVRRISEKREHLSSFGSQEREKRQRERGPSK